LVAGSAQILSSYKKIVYVGIIRTLISPRGNIVENVEDFDDDKT